MKLKDIEKDFDERMEYFFARNNIEINHIQISQGIKAFYTSKFKELLETMPCKERFDGIGNCEFEELIERTADVESFMQGKEEMKKELREWRNNITK